MCVSTIETLEPSEHIEKPPYPLRIREHSLAANVKSKSLDKCNTSYEQIETQPQVAIIKELSIEDSNKQGICYMEPATNVVRRKSHLNNSGKPIISVTIGTHCYHGLCDIGPSVSAIPFAFYKEISEDISPLGIEKLI